MASVAGAEEEVVPLVACLWDANSSARLSMLSWAGVLDDSTSLSFLGGDATSLAGDATPFGGDATSSLPSFDRLVARAAK